MSGRELLTPDEVRKLNNRYALLFIRGASPVMDEKYDLMHHPAISHSSLGGAAPYIHHGTKPLAVRCFEWAVPKQSIH